MKCAGCFEPIEIGDRFIKARPSEFMGNEDGGLDDVMAALLGGHDGEVAYCEGCTQEGGRFRLKTFYGEGFGDGGHE